MTMMKATFADKDGSSTSTVKLSLDKKENKYLMKKMKNDDIYDDDDANLNCPIVDLFPGTII